MRFASAEEQVNGILLIDLTLKILATQVRQFKSLKIGESMGTAKGEITDWNNEKRVPLVTNTADKFRRALGDVTEQVSFESCALHAVGDILCLEKGDVLLCEATCLRYAMHAALIEDGPREVWLVPPLQSGVRPAIDLMDEFETTISENHADSLNFLKNLGGVFKGFTATVPEGPFKLLITTDYCGVPIASALEWPEYNSFWIDMLNTDGAMGAVVYPPADKQNTKNQSLREGNLCTGDFAKALELPDGHIVLGLGKLDETFFMEDLTDPDNPWTYEMTPLALSVNDGCLVPSICRTGIEILEETTLGELASRISRGTSLSEKDLDIKERLDSRVVEQPDCLTARKSDADKPKQKKGRTFGFSGGVYTMRDKWAYALEDDLYYIDGSCFRNGEIWPTVIDSIPKGQERYIVDKRDGEVILVLRNSKEPVVYKAVRPTLISNNVFVIKFDSNINREYLACWMRGTFAKHQMQCSGKILSKSILDNLPIPILRNEIMNQVVRYERLLDDKIFMLREEIGELESKNRFAPLAATRGE